MSRRVVVILLILLLTTNFLANGAAIERTNEDVDDSVRLLRVKRRGRGGRGGRGGSYGTRVSMSRGGGDAMKQILGIKTAVLGGLLLMKAFSGGLPGKGTATDNPIITNITPATAIDGGRRRRKRYLEVDVPTPDPNMQIRQ